MHLSNSPSNKSADGLTETLISSQSVGDTKFLIVKCDKVKLPSGHEGEREYIVHPGAVLVIPMLDDGRLVLERQYRHPLGRVFIELPAGKIDPNESPLLTGQRELFEETGYLAEEWIYLTAQHPCIGYSDEIIYVYLARGLQAGQHQRDADEALEVFEASLPECLSMVQRGEITDGKTIIALFWLEKYLQGLWPAGS